MFDPTRPPPAPGQMGITSANPYQTMQQTQGQRVAPAMPNIPQMGGGFQMPQMPQMGGGQPQFGGQVGIGQINDLVNTLPGGGVQNMPNIGPRPAPGMNRGGMGGQNIQGFIDALRGWIGQRPEDMSQQGARQEWMGQRPTFQGFNSTPPEVI